MCEETNKDFIKGDLVMLKNGGYTMRIEDITNDKEVLVSWLYNGVIYSHFFPKTSLVYKV